MKTKDRPLESHSAILNSFLELAEVSDEEKALLRAELKRYIETRITKGKWCHPTITQFHTEWYRELYRLANKADPYERLKQVSNVRAKELLKNIKLPGFRDKVMLSIIGNKLDFGACMAERYDISRLEEDVRNLSQETLHVDDTERLLERIHSAKNVWYLFDNNGEMIFDTLLLDFLKSEVPMTKIYLVGKESPMLNDVTVEDLRTHGMHHYGKIVSTGSNCFGLHEEEVSDEFKELFHEADLVIAKGQAYFEFFMEYNFSNILHLLRVKYDITGVNIQPMSPGQNIVMSSERYAGLGYDYRWDYSRRRP